MQIHIYIYMQHHNDTISKQTREGSFRKYIPLNLFAWFEGVVWGSTVRGLFQQYILTPTLMTVSVVSFSFSKAAQPAAQKPTLLAFSTTSYQQLLWVSTNLGGASVWPGFPYHISSITRLISNSLTSVLTELYNSSTPTQ